MARQPAARAPFPISARTSSIGAYTTPSERSVSQVNSREALGVSDKSRKAQKILGTEEPGPKKLNGGPSMNSILESKGETEDLHNALVPEPDPPSLHELRVRASSPLLGQNYRAHQPSFVPFPPETRQVRKSGSWSELHSVPEAQRSAFESQSQPNLVYDGVDNNNSRGIRLPGSQNSRLDETSQKRDQTKETRRKMRPNRIDLSLLFPKPKTVQAPKTVPAPLLSPQRYTNSPSPVADDYNFGKPRKFERTSSAANKLTKADTRSRSNSRKQLEARIPEDGPLPPMPERKAMDWFDVQMERAIRCADGVDPAELSDIDGQPQGSTTIPSPPSERRQSKDLGSQPQKSIQQRIGYSKSSDDSAKRLSSNASYTSRSVETHLSPKPMTPISSRIRSSLQAWQSDPDARLTSSVKKTVSKKISNSTLMNSDLTKSSVLCLSSSEDEDEDDDEEPAKQNAPGVDLRRDSVATYDDFEPEICTAEAVMATKGPTLTRLDKRYSTSSSGSRHASRSRTRSRNVPLSPSTARSSQSAKKRESRGSSIVPTISEPDDFHEGIVPRQPLYSNSNSSNRRSRIIAVTRQEESWLEAMRQRNGRITPSLFNELQDSETGSALLSPPPQPPRSHDSVHNTDTSFLRLSMGMPSPRGMATSPDQGAPSKENEGSMLGASSDTEQRLDNSNLSPRVSLVYSDTHSSPSTGYASPLTPTLPIHRFSPHPPPSFAPPPVPEPARRHSRRRTDSSEAIVLGESGDTKGQEQEYPLWAIKWSRDSADLAIAH
ncbi:hypothetical protein VTN77DRAFT_7590 [Rasamsonia byssochlamydoides]|uniref:uncharacterized protein n=1 Tax=Rasamsonia byssochlamydoides TaxID=89139 RepID=UPI00374451ED